VVGGGGIPVAFEDGKLRGVEAVIDKDYTACLLAKNLNIPELVICTGIDRLYLNYGTEEAQPLASLDKETARKYLNEGQFPPGNMGPKVEALIDFLDSGGQRALLSRLESLTDALAGKAGTGLTR